MVQLGCTTFIHKKCLQKKTTSAIIQEIYHYLLLNEDKIIHTACDQRP